jgi:hypothetical protein
MSGPAPEDRRHYELLRTPREWTCVVPFTSEFLANVGSYTGGSIEAHVLTEIGVFDQVGVLFRAQVLEDQPRRQVEVALTAGAPVNWWQHWKAEFAPRWYLRYWPVQRRAYQVTLTSEAHRLFPKADVVPSVLGAPVVVVDHVTNVKDIGTTTLRNGWAWPVPSSSVTPDDDDELAGGERGEGTWRVEEVR